MMMKDLCLRCGKCCQFNINGRIEKCSYLVELKNGRTYCKIYSRRLGRLLKTSVKGLYAKCFLREQVKNDFEGCPYNKGISFDNGEE
jgi:hypothetical protein